MAKSKAAAPKDNHDSFLQSLLRDSLLPRDALPYTDEFKKLKSRFEDHVGSKQAEQAFWRALCAAGKKGGASGGERKKSPGPVPLTHNQKLELLRLFPDGIGGRDSLPFTQQFDELHERFQWLTATKLSKREFWRALVNVAKMSRKPTPLADEIEPGNLPLELVESLSQQNPWWRGEAWLPTQPVRRWAYDEVVSRLDSELSPIVALRGTRQVGKSEIQRQLVEELLLLRHVPPSHILRVQFDESPALGRLTAPIQAIVSWFEQSILKDSLNAAANRGESVYLLFDELQNIASWANQLKALVDFHKVKVVATGSSALRITAGQDSLAGRISMIDLGPYRLNEIAAIRFKKQLPKFSTAADIDRWTTPEFWRELSQFAQQYRETLEESFAAYVDVGGYPLCHKLSNAGLESRLHLRQEAKALIVERTIRADIKAGDGGRNRIDHVVESVFRHTCRYAGQLASPKLIREEAERRGLEPITIGAATDALDFLTESLLLQEIPVIEGVGKKPASSSKYCLSDHFIREAWLSEQIPLTSSGLSRCTEAVTTQAGHLAESVVGAFLASLPDVEVSWLPGSDAQGEIDFVLTLGLKRIPIEVKYRAKLNGDETQHLVTFCQDPKWEAAFGLVITRDTFDERNGMIYLPLFALLALR